MQVIRNDADVDGIKDPELKCLIGRRIEEAAEYVDHFSDLVFFVVIEVGDGVDCADAALGFSLLVNRFDGVPYGSPSFSPSWDVLVEHAGYYEFVFVLGDDGAGVEVFVSKQPGAPAALQAMCRQYAVVEADT